eukprot:gnl/MRDRNA2_/MRDRNA2_152563_c0_seq1.p1 gnl/MRDRNA2_/MRDRNA2_152563_c0~~gnl/MRDRNA2_/MRDRNA2_152563_c0_seq1.p1  ORF type:complete len:146 (-),score=36.27 gnl/MRDRNA2_/MRDRNA2_152563_c0_seq1:167-604(-)
MSGPVSALGEPLVQTPHAGSRILKALALVSLTLGGLGMVQLMTSREGQEQQPEQSQQEEQLQSSAISMPSAMIQKWPIGSKPFKGYGQRVFPPGAFPSAPIKPGAFKASHAAGAAMYDSALDSPDVPWQTDAKQDMPGKCGFCIG